MDIHMALSSHNKRPVAMLCLKASLWDCRVDGFGRLSLSLVAVSNTDLTAMDSLRIHNLVSFAPLNTWPL